MNIPHSESQVPTLTTQQMIEVDRAMIEDYEIQLIQMMENAGRNLAHLARMRFLSGNPGIKNILIMAGTGGNGGGALVCGRRLANWGATVAVFITKKGDDFSPVPAHQLNILQRMGVSISPAANVGENTARPALIIDGIIGYSLKGAPRGTAADLIQWANEQETPILALDTPSGLDTSTGQAYKPTIKASATMTLALPKAGLFSEQARKQIGELYLADISVPPQLYARPNLAINVGPIFSESEIIRLY